MLHASSLSAPDRLRRRVPEEAAEVVPVLGLRRVPALRGGEGEGHRLAVHGAVRRVQPDAPDGLPVTSRVLTPKRAVLLGRRPDPATMLQRERSVFPPVVSEAAPAESRIMLEL